MEEIRMRKFLPYEYQLSQRVHQIVLVILSTHLISINLSSHPQLVENRFLLNLIAIGTFAFSFLYYHLVTSRYPQRWAFFLGINIYLTFIFSSLLFSGWDQSPLQYLLLVPLLFGGFLVSPTDIVILTILVLFGGLLVFSNLQGHYGTLEFFTPIVVVAVIAILIAIEIRRREQNLTEAHKIAGGLEDVARLKDEFIALISHNLHTPLTSIKGFLEILTKNEALKQSRETYEPLLLLRTQVQRLETIIENLTEVYSLKMGARKVEIRKVKLATLLEIILDDKLNQKALKKNIHLQQNIQIPISEQLSVDPNWFSLAIQNLLDNAIKFSPSDGTVTLSIAKTKDAFVFTVADKGPGIKTEEQNRIFQIFHREKGEYLQYGYEGIGVGLYFTRTIIDLHNGKISIKSKLNQGTEVQVKIPIPSLDTFLETLD